MHVAIKSDRVPPRCTRISQSLSDGSDCTLTILIKMRVVRYNATTRSNLVFSIIRFEFGRRFFSTRWDEAIGIRQFWVKLVWRT